MKVKVTKKLKSSGIEVPISTEFIRLDAFLKFAAVCGTGGEAKMLIQDGLIYVNGEVCNQRGKKLFPGDRVSFQGNTYAVKNG